MMLARMMSGDFNESTFSPELQDGKLLSVSPDGPQNGPSGLVPVPANPSHQRASRRAQKTPATCGPSLDASSPSAVLQSCLESRLALDLDVNGSPEYVLTWKHWDMLSGPPICALRARARRTSDSDFSGRHSPKTADSVGTYSDPARQRDLRADMDLLAGWPSCAARDWKNGKSNLHGVNARPLSEVAMLAGYLTPDAGNFEAKDLECLLRRRQECKERHGQNGFGLALGRMVPPEFSGYPTPTKSDPDRGSEVMMRRGNNYTLLGAARLVGYATPRTTDGDKNVRSPDGALREVERKGSCNDLGTTSMLFSAETRKCGASQLNPSFSLWLMGFPAEWVNFAPVVMPSSRR